MARARNLNFCVELGVGPANALMAADQSGTPGVVGDRALQVRADRFANQGRLIRARGLRFAKHGRLYASLPPPGNASWRKPSRTLRMTRETLLS